MLGLWDVDQLADEMPASTFYEWMAYYAVEPWGEVRGDISNAKGFATLCSITATAASAHKRITYKASDFMPKFGQPTKRPDTAAEGQARWLRNKEALMMHGRIGVAAAGGPC